MSNSDFLLFLTGKETQNNKFRRALSCKSHLGHICISGSEVSLKADHLKLADLSHGAMKPKARGFDLWLLEQQERRARIARVCSSSSRRRRGAPIKTRSVDRLMFHFNEEHRLLFCFQPKVTYNRYFTFQKRCCFPGWVKYMVELFHKLGRGFNQ